VKRALWLLALLGACDDTTTGETRDVWLCSALHDGWERCVDDAIEWCHGLGEPHFHIAQDCAADGLTCATNPRDHLAYCVHAQPCPGLVGGICEGSEAVNCLDGARATRRCADDAPCVVSEGWARCSTL
jgi:hypothetical protein